MDVDEVSIVCCPPRPTNTGEAVKISVTSSLSLDYTKLDHLPSQTH